MEIVSHTPVGSQLSALSLHISLLLSQFQLHGQIQPTVGGDERNEFHIDRNRNRNCGGGRGNTI